MIRSDKNSYSSVYDGTTSIGKIMKGTLKVYDGWKKLIASGVPPITLQKCKGGNLIDYKIYGNSVQEHLPSEYQQVEYIETTGTQYINTGLKGNVNFSAKIVYEFTTEKGGHILSSYDQYILVHNNATDKWSIGVRYGSETWVAYGLTVNQKYTTVIDNDITINNEVLCSNFSKGNVDANRTLCFMTWGGQPDNSSYRFIGKMYSCKIYDAGVLVRNFVPCYRKSDNVIGMYDLANNVFYTNAGTETFLKGNDVSAEIQKVGEKTKNLFSRTSYEGPIDWGINDKNTMNVVSVEPNRPYTFSFQSFERIDVNTTGNVSMYVYNNPSFSEANNGRLIAIILNSSGNSGSTFISKTINSGNNTELYFILRNTNGKSTRIKIDGMMLTKGNILNDYEEYGYKIPVKVINELGEENTTNVYIDKPLGENEYVSFSEDNLSDISLNKGTNIIEVDTNILPSNMEVKYIGKE